MKIKTVSWNIGGAKTLQPGTDPGLMASYNVDAIDDIVEKLKAISPDVIAFQEIQKNDSYDQAALIASKLGYNYFINESFSWSHNEAGADLGNAIVSKYPIISHQVGTFLNPNISVLWEDGTTAVTHDKGYIQATLDVNGIEVSVLTLHLTPFRKFGMELDDEKALEILADVSEKIISHSGDRTVVLGDFNIDGATIGHYFPDFREAGFEEASTDGPTTPKNRTYDHLLYKGLQLTDKSIDSDVLTDHYILITDLELN